MENEKILLATVKSSLLEAFKVFPSMFKKENLNLTQVLENEAKQTKLNKSLKRSATDETGKRRSILETFCKRSKTEGWTYIMHVYPDYI